jgi:hypothetical protein
VRQRLNGILSGELLEYVFHAEYLLVQLKQGELIPDGK